MTIRVGHHELFRSQVSILMVHQVIQREVPDYAVLYTMGNFENRGIEIYLEPSLHCKCPYTTNRSFYDFVIYNLGFSANINEAYYRQYIRIFLTV